jgi:putative ABC transport system permease protein
MYAAVKIGGFALSIAACLLIALFIKDELSYDKSYPNAARIYRLVGYAEENGITQKWVSFPAPAASALQKDFPEVEASGRFMPNSLFPRAGSNEVTIQGKIESSHEEGFTYADQSILNMFSIPAVYGDAAHALTAPNSIVIAKSKADKFFPGQNPVGKILYFNNNTNQPYTITAVIPDFPANSHLKKYNYLLTLSGVEWWKGEQNDWDANNYCNYVLLRPGTNIDEFEKKATKDLLYNYYLPTMLRDGDKNAKKELEESKFTLHAQPVASINLYSYDIPDGLSHGDIRFVWLFAAIACFILVIACINFINLSTAKSANRAKEVGLRKAVGSQRSGLIKQFLIESILYSSLAFIIGLLLAWVLLPYFNILSSKSLTIPWAAWWLAPVMLGASVIVGVLAGLYPSFYLSAFKPINVLKGNISRGSKNAVLRNGLVVFQFATSVILIVSTIVIYSQVKFILNQKVGYDKNQVMLLQGTGTLGDKVATLKTELLKLPHVQSVSISDYLPIANTKRNGNSFWINGKQNTETGIDCQVWQVDNDYIKTLGMKIVAGRDFSPKIASDSQGLIINQTLVEKLHLKNPVGQKIANGNTIFPVIGVVQDFNFESLHDSVGGLVMRLGRSSSIVSVKINTANAGNVIPNVEALWKKLAPAQPIRYTFLDESFAAMYADVQSMGRIFTTFAVLAIVIACLGLFALSAFIAEQRGKEIGIRKVLGASVQGITTLLSKDFVKLVLIAIVIATPAGWWGMTKWLEGFAYKVPLSWWMFAAAGLLAIIIALATVSFQAIKAAIANPVKSLRSE